ncbi:MAG: hypothetical protein V4573_20445 [Pseudomonadota bacterium]
MTADMDANGRSAQVLSSSSFAYFQLLPFKAIEGLLKRSTSAEVQQPAQAGKRRVYIMQGDVNRKIADVTIFTMTAFRWLLNYFNAS